MIDLLGGRRRRETLDAGPSAAPLLDALTRRLGTLTDELVVQPARPGPWTAFYRGTHLIALARQSSIGASSSLDVASPAIAWAATLTKPADVDGEEVGSKLRLAVERAPESTPESFAEMTGTGFGPVGTLLALGSIAFALLAWLFRTAEERRIAAAGGTQRELVILNAARGEVRRRTNSLTLGCLGAILVGFVSLFVVVFVGAWLSSLGLAALGAAALWLVPLPAALLVFARIRRRYPYPPRGRREPGKILRNVLGFAVALAALLVIGALTNGGR